MPSRTYTTFQVYKNSNSQHENRSINFQDKRTADEQNILDKIRVLVSKLEENDSGEDSIETVDSDVDSKDSERVDLEIIEETDEHGNATPDFIEKRLGTPDFVEKRDLVEQNISESMLLDLDSINCALEQVNTIPVKHDSSFFSFEKTEKHELEQVSLQLNPSHNNREPKTLEEIRYQNPMENITNSPAFFNLPTEILSKIELQPSNEEILSEKLSLEAIENAMKDCAIEASRKLTVAYMENSLRRVFLGGHSIHDDSKEMSSDSDGLPEMEFEIMDFEQDFEQDFELEMPVMNESESKTFDLRLNDEFEPKTDTITESLLENDTVRCSSPETYMKSESDRVQACNLVETGLLDRNDLKLSVSDQLDLLAKKLSENALDDAKNEGK